MGGVILTILLALTVMLFTDIGWQHRCLLGRLPIFLCGIITCFLIEEGEGSTIFRMQIAVPAAVAGVTLCVIDHVSGISLRFLGTALAAPLLIAGLAAVHDTVARQRRLYAAICFIGVYSLEFYIANCFSMAVTHVFSDMWVILVIYIVLNFTVPFAVIAINRRLVSVAERVAGLGATGKAAN